MAVRLRGVLPDRRLGEEGTLEAVALPAAQARGSLVGGGEKGLHHAAIPRVGTVVRRVIAAASPAGPRAWKPPSGNPCGSAYPTTARAAAPEVPGSKEAKVRAIPSSIGVGMKPSSRWALLESTRTSQVE